MIATVFSLLLAVLSVWDYPARQQQHEKLRRDFLVAMRAGDAEDMKAACEAGVKLLPDDPTWQYNLACALAYYKDQEPAFDALEKAIDLGFRDVDQIRVDTDLARLHKNPRWQETLEYAEERKTKPIMLGPLATVPATGVFGKSIALGEQNLAWDFDTGVFQALLKLVPEGAGGNLGDLYMNRDGDHSRCVVTNWPGLTEVKFDREGRARGMQLNFPNTLFPYPVFGNSSMGFTQGPYWRSIPRALVTTEARRLGAMAKFYLSNQVWVYPAVNDVNFSTNFYGDVFASVTPYWIVTKGISWSDQYYLRSALEISRSLRPEVKKEIVAKGLLAPTVQAIVRKSIKGVKSEEDYLTALAHPTAMPPAGLDQKRMKQLAAGLKADEIPPLARIAAVAPEQVDYRGKFPELTYTSPFAWAFVLRAAAPRRSFIVKVDGGDEYAFSVVHGAEGAAKLERLAPDVAKITLEKSLVSPTNRVDLAMFAKTKKSGWGAPSFISFAVMDSSYPYSDPVLTPVEELPAE